MQDGQAAYYDEYWKKGVLGWSARVRKTSLYEFRRLENVLKPGMRILDVGCGSGRLAAWFKDRGMDYTGVDISQSAVDELRGRGFNVHRADIMESLPFADGTFDLVVIFEVLEHLFAPQSCLAEMRRVLKPGGLLTGSVPNIAFLPLRLFLLAGIFNPGGAPSTALRAPWCDPHIRFFTSRSLRRFLRSETDMAAPRIVGCPFSLLNFPVLYKTRGLLRTVVKGLSLPFAFAGRVYPGLFASHLFFDARRSGEKES